MSEKTKKLKPLTAIQRYGKLLYMTGDYSQKMIAVECDTSEQTVSAWVKKYDWDVERQQRLNNVEDLIQFSYIQINIIKERAQDQDRGMTPAEIDSMTKLVNNIFKLQPKVGPKMISGVLANFIEFIADNDLELAQKITGHMREYMKKIS